MKMEKDDIIVRKEAVKHEWLRRKDVTGIDVGCKYVGGKRTGEVAIRLFVRKKLASVAPEERFPSRIGNHKTDVIEREFRPCSNPVDTALHDPMIGGVILWSAEANSSATAGMFVRDNETGQLMILGTFHGDAGPGSPIEQGGAQIGCVIRGGRHLITRLDVDLFSFGAPRSRHFSIADIGSVTGVRAVGVQDIGVLRVQKRGYYTGHTHGTLDGMLGDFTDTALGITYHFQLSFKVDDSIEPVFWRPGTKTALFGHAGDSGSIILDSDNKAVAMLTWEHGHDDGSPDGNGPPMPLILSEMNITPCFPGTVLQESVKLDCNEGPFNLNGPGGSGDTDPAASDWGKSVSGVANLRAYPTCIVKPYNWTLTNTPNALTFTAEATGFDQPVFSWRVNGQIINDFSSNASVTIGFRTLVGSDSPDNPGQLMPTFDVPVTVRCYPDNSATYDCGDASASLRIEPTKVQGHIFLVVQVDVRSKDSPVLASAGAVRSESMNAVLDTQQLVFEDAYYHDREKCKNGLREVFNSSVEPPAGNPRHPYTIISLLLDQPYPPSGILQGQQFMQQLSVELQDLSRNQPKLARKLSRVFATTLDVPRGVLLDGAGK
jgi:hypothetical protein